jgi:NAD(P)-dependent dehydrogenase (short-subunit alcohol dehydrogenase family)
LCCAPGAGSGRGIGFSTARVLGRLGATVIITDMQQRWIDEAVQQLQQDDPRCAGRAPPAPGPALQHGASSSKHR